MEDSHHPFPTGGLGDLLLRACTEHSPQVRIRSIRVRGARAKEITRAAPLRSPHDAAIGRAHRSSPALTPDYGSPTPCPTARLAFSRRTLLLSSLSSALPSVDPQPLMLFTNRGSLRFGASTHRGCDVNAARPEWLPSPLQRENTRRTETGEEALGAHHLVSPEIVEDFLRFAGRREPVHRGIDLLDPIAGPHTKGLLLGCRVRTEVGRQNVEP